jgi:hypothetical protein
VVHRNWGGTLKLNYMFSEDLRSVGAKYYRVSVVAADATGAPTGSRKAWNQGLAWRKSVGGVIVPVTLGPFTVGGQDALYLIPYDTEIMPENWEADQYHVLLNTNDADWNNPLARHLVTIEIFDVAGQRLRPNGTAPSGLGGAEGTAAFTYRRRLAATGPTGNVPFGALTHLFWWDNRDLTAHIAELMKGPEASDEECQFMVGTAASTFGIRYRAYHPEERFQNGHSITWRRGLSGGSGTLPNAAGGVNVGVPPAAAGDSGQASFATMLGGHRRCAFSVILDVYGKLTDGDSFGLPHLADIASFALEVA